MRPQPEGRGEPKPPGIAFPARCASMRPQPEGRGERISGSGRIFRRLGFNAATARRPWRTDFLEILKAKPQRFSAPQPEGRGELNGQRLIGVAQSGFNAATARRPWRTSGSVNSCHAPVTLQCGHSPKAVENNRPRTLSGPVSTVLQCGHSPKAVENGRL